MLDVAGHLGYSFQNAGVHGEMVEPTDMLDKSLGHSDRLSFCFSIDETSSIAIWPVAALFR